MNVLLIEEDFEQAEQVMLKARHQPELDLKVIGPFSEVGKALTYLQNKAFQIALIDLDTYAGTHIADMIMKLHPVPMLFVSHRSDKELVNKVDQIPCSSFLQKPYNEQSFSSALYHTIQRSTKGLTVSMRHLTGQADSAWIWIKCDRSMYQKVNPQEIVCVEALDHYCRFHFRERPPITIKARLKCEIYERDLSHYDSFYLLNRSTIINLNAVDQVEGNRLILQDFKPLNNNKLIVPKERRAELFEHLGILQG